MSGRAPTGASALEALARAHPELVAAVAGVGCAGHGLQRLSAAVADLVPAITAFTGCAVHVLADDGRSLLLTAASGPGWGQVGTRRHAAGEGLPGWVAAHRQPRTVPDDPDPARAADPAPPGGADPAPPGGAERHCLPVIDPRSGLVAVIEAGGPRGSAAAGAAALLRLVSGVLTPALCQARLLERARLRGVSAERFAERAVAAQEAERARLSREIHDGISQRLAGVGFHLSAAASLLPAGVQADGTREQIGLARALVDLAAAEMRAAIGGLRPPILDDLGLPAALASLARESQARAGQVEIGVSVLGELTDPLPDHVQTALYRIAQESLGNALAHAAPQTVDLILDLDATRVTLTVADDGRGFRLAPGRDDGGDDGPAPEDGRSSYGLRGMRERAELVGGWLAVTSRPNVGTQVRAVVPLPVRPQAPPAGDGPQLPDGPG